MGERQPSCFLCGCYNLLTQQDSVLSRHIGAPRWVFVSSREAVIGGKPESKCMRSAILAVAAREAENLVFFSILQITQLPGWP